ncbi:electron transfer flavoprotein subunit alpha/FixB family protein [bacterium]|nr:electron transfer flavoprotein subunit alpha/FixB family protein [bacterium]
MANNILVITEQTQGEFRKSSFEALSEARRLADQAGGSVAALVIGSGLDDLTKMPAQYGADIVLKADDDQVSVYEPDIYTATVEAVAESQNAKIILMPATDQGKDLAPRVAARLNAGLADDCLKLELKGDVIEADRPMYAGKAIARVSVQSEVKVATLRPNVFAVSAPDSSRSASVESLSVPDVTKKTVLKEFKAAEGAKLDVSEADIIVTGGRGMKDAENFKMLEEMADLLGGAVGSTRAAVDAGWRLHADQVGQTGKTVTPNLYMMFGASGAIQHWAGMSGAKCIVAVNKNPEAPIMEKADYSIVGDLFEVVPAMIEEIRKIRG